MVLNEIDWNQFDHAHPYYGDFFIKAKGNRTRRIIYKVFYLEENGMQSLIQVSTVSSPMIGKAFQKKR